LSTHLRLGRPSGLFPSGMPTNILYARYALTLQNTGCSNERYPCTHYRRVEVRADIKQVWAIIAVATAEWDPAALRKKQLNDPAIGPIREEGETGQRPEWKDIANCSTMYKSYWAQWKLLAVRNGILQHDWESANGQSQIAQIVLPQSRVRMCWLNYMANHQEVTWVSTKTWIMFCNDTSGSRQEVILRDGADCVTSA
jgi:hypothetical protein